MLAIMGSLGEINQLETIYNVAMLAGLTQCAPCVEDRQILSLPTSFR